MGADALELEPLNGRFLEFPQPLLDPRPLPPDEVCCKDILGTQSDDYVVEETFTKVEIKTTLPLALFQR